MSVVGFDIGNENCVVAVAKSRGIDVLLNDESKRETPAVVCFGEKQRFLGSAGAASAMMHPKSTISQVKRLIGRQFSDPDVEKDLRMLPLVTSEALDGGILIHLKYLEGRDYAFTPVQIMAMLFAHLKSMTERELESSISDCVIGIPSYFNDLQRRAYLDAARIVGLKPLRLIHDCTATALSYGIYKTGIEIGEGPTYVAFVDIGHCDTQVCIAAFEFGEMRVLSHAFDRSLGGRDFDEVLFSHFAEKFKDEYSIDVYSNAKASIRLRAACEKLKKVLSANPEAPLNIECLMDEKDVKGFITREDFETLSSDLLDRIFIPCHQALVDAGLAPENIYSVELVGSGSRIPAISAMLNSLFKREPSRKLNASECVARGCALQCAMLSPLYHVRDYEVQDIIPFSIGLLSDGISSGSDDVVFPKCHPVPSTAVIAFQRTTSFHVEAIYADPNELPPGTSPKISFFTSDSTRKDKASKRVLFPVNENIYGRMTTAEISEACETEHQLAQQDRIMELTKEKKNSLESYVYEMRSKLFNTYRDFASEQERDDISRSLQETEDWLYEDGDDETEHAYSSKLEDLKKLVDPIEIRYKEVEGRTQATSDLLKCISEHRKSADSLQPQDKEMIISECNKAEQWLAEKIQQQESYPTNTEPIVRSSDISRMTQNLNLGKLVHQYYTHKNVKLRIKNLEAELGNQREEINHLRAGMDKMTALLEALLAAQAQSQQPPPPPPTSQQVLVSETITPAGPAIPVAIQNQAPTCYPWGMPANFLPAGCIPSPDGQGQCQRQAVTTPLTAAIPSLLVVGAPTIIHAAPQVVDPFAVYHRDVAHDPVHDVKAQFAELNKKLKAIEGKDLFRKKTQEMCLVQNVRIPHKFKVPTFEKYKGDSCPQIHLTMYCRKMAAHIDDDKLLMHYFQDSLTGASLKWYMNLDNSKISCFTDLSKAFVRQYKYNLDMAPDRDQLRSMSQKDNETFKEYVQRWRELAAQIDPPMSEKEMAKMFINTLSSFYYERMIVSAPNDFTEMVRMGVRLEQAIKEGRLKKEEAVSSGTKKYGFPKKKEGETNVVLSTGPRRSRRIKNAPQAHPQYYQPTAPVVHVALQPQYTVYPTQLPPPQPTHYQQRPCFVTNSGSRKHLNNWMMTDIPEVIHFSK